MGSFRKSAGIVKINVKVRRLHKDFIGGLSKRGPKKAFPKSAHHYKYKSEFDIKSWRNWQKVPER